MSVSFVSRYLPILIASWAIIAVPASAANFDYDVANVGLLMVKEVQTDIGITKAQKDKMNVHADWFNSQVKKIQTSYQAALKKDSKAKPPVAQMNKLGADFKKKVLGVLTASQIKRLREITLQDAGNLALLDPIVAKKLGLTAAQQKGLKAKFASNSKKGAELQAKTFNPIREKYAKKKPKSEAEAKKLSEAMRKEFDAAAKKIKPQLEKLQKEWDAYVLQSLSKSQEASFKALKGKPIKKS